MRQERAERTKTALTLAAAAMFDRVGYERTTLSEVSGLAAVSKGALSFHFASKAELADTVQTLACATARSSAEYLQKRDLPAMQTLIDMSHAAAHQLAYDETIRAGVRLTRERATPPEVDINLDANWRELFTDVAVEAGADHSLQFDAPPRVVAALALNMVSGVQFQQGVPGFEVRPWLTDQWELLLPSLMAEHCPWPLLAAGAEDWELQEA